MNYNIFDKVKELPAYANSYQLSKIIHEEIIKWSNFYKYSIGSQLIRAVDSVSANIAEGYGRFFYKEKLLFYYYARGSLCETVDWLRKAYDRKLIDDAKVKKIKELINKVEKDLTILISRNRQNKS